MTFVTASPQNSIPYEEEGSKIFLGSHWNVHAGNSVLGQGERGIRNDPARPTVNVARPFSLTVATAVSSSMCILRKWSVLARKGNLLMRRVLAFLLTICLSNLSLQAASSPLATKPVDQDEDYSYESFSSEQLDNLLAPIALYPDPLLSQVLVAATFVDDVDEAARWVRANGTNGIDDQPWDVSVKAVAHYPTVIYMMADKIDGTSEFRQ
ncbi:MAG TPA: DUF3300 domain-containing protein [Candidatus Acidoferrum sp.]|nr:DUF3300 domain-containing protein [Candidatus Acidoferrum sp.]